MSFISTIAAAALIAIAATSDVSAFAPHPHQHHASASATHHCSIISSSNGYLASSRAHSIPAKRGRNNDDSFDHTALLTLQMTATPAMDNFYNGNGDTSQQEKSIESTKTTTSSLLSFLKVLWQFTRPHTILGSAIAIPSIFLLAAPTYNSFFTGRTLSALIYTAVPSLLMNLYITGLNQITDVEIDKINKPDLPIARGDLKLSTAIKVVLIAGAISLIMSVAHPIFSTNGLLVAIWGSFLLGTLYSLPPFRMKRHPLLAAFCIVAVRGSIINAGFYSHALSAAYGLSSPDMGVLSCLLNDWRCMLSSLYFGVFGIVIALMKDVPDAHGDRIFNIRSFTVRMGQKTVFGSMKNLLASLFGAFGVGMARWAMIAPSVDVTLRRGLVGLSCLVAGWSVNNKAKDVDAEDSKEVYNYYMYLWKLFYASYLVLPFAK